MESSQDEMPFLDHLEALRWHLIRAIIAVLAVGVVAFVCKDFIFQIIFAPKNGDFFTYRMFCKIGHLFGFKSAFCAEQLPFTIQSRTMAGQFSAHIWTSIWAGVILAFPYVLYEVWKFISPALYGYYLITPLSVNFLGSYSVSPEVRNQIDLNSYISVVRSSVISCGIIFELPIVVYFLTKLGVITPAFMRKYRRHAVIVVLIIAAIITPPDVVSQIIVSIPIMLLYEISIFISAYVLKKEQNKVI